MNNQMTATEWSKQYVQEWFVEGETELWAGQSSKHRGNPVVSVVHCSSFDGEPACIEVRLGKRLHASVPATRNWQNERRAQVKVGMLLAGADPDPGHHAGSQGHADVRQRRRGLGPRAGHLRLRTQSHDLRLRALQRHQNRVRSIHGAPRRLP